MLSTEPARFDWYGATVETEPLALVEQLGTLIADESPRRVPALRPYSFGWELRRDGSRAAVVYGGGASEWPHVVGTGPDAVPVARLLRSEGMPVHRVARADVCVDTDTPGAFVELVAGLRSVIGAASARMIVPDRAEEGATYYVGSSTSEMMARLYEKGRQLDSVQRPHWVRYEGQIRPQKLRKVWAATASEEALLGASRWGRRFAAGTLGLVAPAPPVRPERVSDLDGAMNALAAQYGPRLVELVARHEGDLGAALADVLRRVPVRSADVA